MTDQIETRALAWPGSRFPADGGLGHSGWFADVPSFQSPAGRVTTSRVPGWAPAIEDCVDEAGACPVAGALLPLAELLSPRGLGPDIGFGRGLDGRPRS
jgi:hypothetical protein